MHVVQGGTQALRHSAEYALLWENRHEGESLPPHMLVRGHPLGMGEECGLVEILGVHMFICA